MSCNNDSAKKGLQRLSFFLVDTTVIANSHLKVSFLHRSFYLPQERLQQKKMRFLQRFEDVGLGTMNSKKIKKYILQAPTLFSYACHSSLGRVYGLVQGGGSWRGWRGGEEKCAGLTIFCGEFRQLHYIIQASTSRGEMNRRTMDSTIEISPWSGHFAQRYTE